MIAWAELIGQNQDTVASIPENESNAVATVRVPFPSTISTTLAGHPDVTLMDPHEEGDTASEVVCKCRIIMWPLPFFRHYWAETTMKK